jgi:hypothetical protein
MERLLLLMLVSVSALAQTGPYDGTITNEQAWAATNWISAWQTEAAVTSPATANIRIGLAGFPTSSGCSMWSINGHGNWNQIQTCLNYNPTEWQIYGAQGQGKAHCDNPGVTRVVDRDSGTPFTSDWTGRAGFYMDSVEGANGNGVQVVSSVGSSLQLTLTTTCTGSGSMTFHFVTTTNDGAVSINGRTVTWVSGQPFNVFDTGTGQWTINGSPYTCSVIGLTTATCNTSGTFTNVPYHADDNINDEISTLRLQKVIGANEENLTCTARAIGSYDCEPQFAGSGTLWPWQLGNGNFTYNGNQQHQVVLQPDGSLTLGGNYLQTSVVIPAQSGQYNENYFQISPGLSTTRTSSPSIAARPCGVCTDIFVSQGFDVYGAGMHTFTSHSFANVEFQVFGVGGSSWLAVGSSSTAAPVISANGAASNINVVLQPKGAGVTSSTAPVQLPAYAVAELPTCSASNQYSLAVVTDASAPSYNATPTGGGAVKIPVFCDGAVWTSH